MGKKLSEIFTQENDPLGFKYFEISESAINTIAAMMGFTLTDLITERGRENPDMQKIGELEKSYFFMGRERQAVYGGDADAMRLVEERYAPVIRERLASVV